MQTTELFTAHQARGAATFAATRPESSMRTSDASRNAVRTIKEISAAGFFKAKLEDKNLHDLEDAEAYLTALGFSTKLKKGVPHCLTVKWV
jgi:hypothetical protein